MKQSWRRWAHLALAAAGVAAVLWAVVLAANPTIRSLALAIRKAAHAPATRGR